MVQHPKSCKRIVHPSAADDLCCTSGEERIKSRSTWDECQAFFEKFEYTVKYLKKCGIPIKEVRPFGMIPSRK